MTMMLRLCDTGTVRLARALSSGNTPKFRHAMVMNGGYGTKCLELSPVDGNLERVVWTSHGIRCREAM